MPTVPPPSVPTPPLDALTPRRRTGRERFHRDGTPIDARLLHFWQWAFSEICSNEVRDLIAEYLVARALDGLGPSRVDWDAWDVRTPSGVKVEVSSAAYLQTWQQAHLSTIAFDIAPEAPPEAPEPAQVPVVRSADVYVFALHAHQDKRTVDPMDVAQWRFFVVPTRLLDERHRDRRRISLEALHRLVVRPVELGELAREVERVAATAAQDVLAPMAPVPESARM